MFKFLIIAGGLFYLYRLMMKPNPELDSTDHNEENIEGNGKGEQNDQDNPKNSSKRNDNGDIEYTDYEEIE